MENYIQQSKGACLIKASSFIDFASSANQYLQNGFYLQNIIYDITFDLRYETVHVRTVSTSSIYSNLFFYCFLFEKPGANVIKQYRGKLLW